MIGLPRLSYMGLCMRAAMVKAFTHFNMASWSGAANTYVRILACSNLKAYFLNTLSSEVQADTL